MTTHTTEQVRIGDLIISPLNARGIYEDASLASIATSIDAVGMIHPLSAHRFKKQIAVLAGGRRLGALKQLAASDEHPNWTNDTLVTVNIYKGSDEEMRALSAAENFTVEPMSDIQVYRAVCAASTAKNCKWTDEMWAQAFGIGVARMRRILRLAHLHPDILAAYEARKIRPDDLKVFGKIADQAEQKMWLDKVEAGEIAMWNVKSAMGFGDRNVAQMLRIVTPAVYVAAGGRLDEDLFGEPEDARVLDTELLEQLLLNAGKAYGEQLQTQFETPIEFVGERPGGHDWYRLRTEPTPDPESAKQLAEIEEHIGNLWTELSEELIADWDEFPIGEEDEESLDPATFDDVISACGFPEKQDELRTALQSMHDLAKKRTEIDSTARMMIPEGAVCHISYGHRGVEHQFYYPTLEAAGLTNGSSNMRDDNAPPKPPKPGEEGFNPDSPPLTQRAIDHIKAMRGRQIARFLDKTPNEAAIAHKALIFEMACSTHRLRSASNMVISFAGCDYTNPGTSLPSPDVPAKIPGFGVKNDERSWADFRDKATPEDIDRLAAWVFACKVQPNINPITSEPLCDAIYPLTDKRVARTFAQPDMDKDFFKLFPKKVLAEFGRHTHDQHAQAVMARKGDSPAEYMAGMHHSAEYMSPAHDWLPSFLRWEDGTTPPAPTGDTIEPTEPDGEDDLSEDFDTGEEE